MSNGEKVHPVKIEDYEGNGTCSACGREGLRWIVTLSDDTRVGVECSAKVCGWRPTRKVYAWTADFVPVAEYRYAEVTFVLWHHKRGNATNTTRNGHLVTVGGALREWARNGWLPDDN